MGQDIRPENARAESDSVDRLKELLFERETATLQGLCERIEQVYARAGNDDQLRDSVARVLDRALVEAEKTRHDQIQRALAPMVVKTVKAEFINSQDDLVEALYPITGRMVKSYVATAIKDLANQINRRIENNSVMLRVRSLVTGRPVSDLAISDSQRLNIDEILLIRRGTGELLERWPDTRLLSNRDIHMSGVLTAINDFAAHAFQGDGGNIRSFAVDDFSMFLRASPTYLLAAKCTGTAASGIQYIIDDEFLQVTERIQQQERPGSREHVASLTLLSEMKERLDDRIKARFDEISAPLPFRPLKVLATLLVLALAGGIGWWAFTEYEASRTRNAASQVIEATPGLKSDYVEMKVGYRGRSLDLAGISPSPAVTDSLIAGLGKELPDVAVKNRLLSLPLASNGAEFELARLRKEFEARQVAATLNMLSGTMRRAEQRLGQALATLPDIERLQASAIAKEDALKAKSLIEQSLRELQSYRGAVDAAPLEAGAVNDMARPLRTLSERLTITSSILTRLLGTETALPRGQGGLATSEGPAGIAEHAAAEADQIAALAIALSLPRAPPETSRQRLIRWVQDNAIFFATDDQFRSPEHAAAKLDRLAQLIKADDAMIRIVGYTDERGSQARNDPLARRRAERVRGELVARGVPPSRLLTMGRATGPDLSPDSGPDSPNRRVEIELGYVGEPRR